MILSLISIGSPSAQAWPSRTCIYVIPHMLVLLVDSSSVIFDSYYIYSCLNAIAQSGLPQVYYEDIKVHCLRRNECQYPFDTGAQELGTPVSTTHNPLHR